MRKAVLGLLFVLAAPLLAQEYDPSILGHTYGLLGDDGGFFVRFESVPGGAPGLTIAEITYPDRTWYVFAGQISPQGPFRIPFLELWPALNPYEMLKHPFEVLNDGGGWGTKVDLGVRCSMIAIELPDHQPIDFACMGGAGIGTLVRLR